ncbi:hypothetical protein LJC00_03855 [Dysgonomonas sp. OttesenSCG-928-M03]|nr:hypothetical protein [Dysgonomonas sp. OttesenSCG-928-M03]
MNRSTRKFIKEICQLLMVIVAVIVFTLVLYTLSRLLPSVSNKTDEDENQINEMRHYHHSQGRTDLLFFN